MFKVMDILDLKQKLTFYASANPCETPENVLRRNAFKAFGCGTKTLQDSICILADNNRRLKADKLAFWWKAYY